ncbi:MAG: zinc-dependent peptidase [Mariprofundaceae bacterium]|nr:zinc-dependent peptidase [Mariprofundaceae bacterium]
MRLFPRHHALRILRRYPITDESWFGVTRRIDLVQALAPVERARLRELATLFLHAKSFTGVQGLTITDEIRISVAAQACLEILNMEADTFIGWVEIVIYPSAFRVAREIRDEGGIVHEEANALSGESWSRGPVILSWEDVRRDSFSPCPGRNVVIHEFAHKLDMLSGRANGMPPLHPDMPIMDWTTALSEAFEHLRCSVEHHYRPHINAYAATNPAEFFAVICEYFFTAPEILNMYCPEVYCQLKAYFRQDTLRYV